MNPQNIPPLPNTPQRFPVNQSIYALKPIMYYLTGILGGFVIVSTVLGLFIRVTSFGLESLRADAAGELGSLITAPIIATYVLQTGLILLGIAWLIKKTRVWDKGAIILSAVISPILLVWVASMILPLFDKSPDAALPGAPVAPIIVVALYGLMAGVVAYNDLKYRQQKAIVNSNEVQI
jgi:uncharacterized membrane protein